jgi:hypothetical protein
MFLKAINKLNPVLIIERHEKRFPELKQHKLFFQEEDDDQEPKKVAKHEHAQCESESKEDEEITAESLKATIEPLRSDSDSVAAAVVTV